MVIANFDKGSTREDVFRIYQYNYGQVLRIQGLTLPPAVEVHFSLQNTGGEATTRIGVTKDGVTDVVIPDSFLENGDATQDYEIYAFIYLRNETSGQTEYKITLHITSRPRPEAFDRPQDAEIFKEAIKVVNESAARSAESEKQAEGWAHGREDLPERAQDNAKYYAGKTEKDAEKTATDRKEVERLVESVSGIDGQVTKVENLTKQAQTSATNAALSEQAAKESENKAAQARAGAEVAEDNAQLAAQKAEQDKLIVEQAKNLVKQMGQEVLDNKSLVDETAQDFTLKAQQALADVNNAGQAQTERVQTAGNDAVESVKAAQGTATRAVETAKTEAIEAVQTEGTTQAGNVSAEGEKQVQAVQGAAQEIMADREQIHANKEGVAKLKEDIVVMRNTKADGIVEVVKGTTVQIKDSANLPLVNFKIFGKSTQDGTPTLDAPVPIKSIGDNGSVNVSVDAQTASIPLKEPLCGVKEIKDEITKDGILRKLKMTEITKDLKIDCDFGKYGAVEKNTIHCVANIDYTKEESVMLCNELEYKTGIWTNDTECCGNSQYGIAFRLLRNRLGLGADTTAEENKAATMKYIENHPLHFVVETKEATKESYPAEVQERLNALHSNKPNTTVTNDADAEMEVFYVADTKTYIDRKLEQLVKVSQTETANLLSLMPDSVQATMIENDTNNILESEVIQ